MPSSDSERDALDPQTRELVRSLEEEERIHGEEQTDEASEWDEEEGEVPLEKTKKKFAAGSESG